MAQVYLNYRGDTYGPYTAAEALRYARSGVLPADARVFLPPGTWGDLDVFLAGAAAEAGVETVDGSASFGVAPEQEQWAAASPPVPQQQTVAPVAAAVAAGAVAGGMAGGSLPPPTGTPVAPGTPYGTPPGSPAVPAQPVPAQTLPAQTVPASAAASGAGSSGPESDKPKSNSRLVFLLVLLAAVIALGGVALGLLVSPFGYALTVVGVLGMIAAVIIGRRSGRSSSGDAADRASNHAAVPGAPPGTPPPPPPPAASVPAPARGAGSVPPPQGQPPAPAQPAAAFGPKPASPAPTAVPPCTGKGDNKAGGPSKTLLVLLAVLCLVLAGGGAYLAASGMVLGYALVALSLLGAVGVLLLLRRADRA